MLRSPPITTAFFAVVVLGSALALLDRSAHACSCISPHARVISPPIGASGVARNARIHAFVEASHGRALSLRRRKGAPVDAAARKGKRGEIDLVELTPASPLDADATYEIVVTRADEIPGAVVIGAFTTGAATDVSAPVMSRAGRARVVYNPRAMTSACVSPWRHVDIEDLAATDTESGRVLFALWVQKAGKLALNELPEVIGTESLALGRDSLCAWTDYAFPASGGPVTFAVAAMDEAGNTSKPQTFTVSVPAGRDP